MVSIYSPKERMYRDLDGQLQYLQPCSIVDRERLRITLNELMTAIGEWPDPDVSFEQLYVSHSRIRALVKQIGELANFDPDKLPGSLLFAFIFPHTPDEGEKQQRSLLAQLNDFTYGEIGLSDPKDVAKEYYKLLAVLWETNKDLRQALDNTKDIPADVLLETLEELALLRGGEEAYKRKMKNQAMEDLKKLTEARKVAQKAKAEAEGNSTEGLEDIGW